MIVEFAWRGNWWGTGQDIYYEDFASNPNVEKSKSIDEDKYLKPDQIWAEYHDGGQVYHGIVLCKMSLLEN